MKKIKSIQLKIILMVGLFLLVSAALIAGYAIYTIRKEAVLLAESEAVGQARQEAVKIQVQIEVALNTARSIAQTFTITPKNPEKKLLTRESAIEILKSILQKNPDFLGTYTAWEPNAFDGKDADFSNKTAHDKSGRFIPNWYRSGSNIALDKLVGYEDMTRNEHGGRTGDYYLIPRETGVEAIIDPYVYEIEGKETLLTSLVAPISNQNRFYGIAGIDISLNFLQHAADSIELYDKTGRMILVSNKGIIAGITGKPELVGKHIKLHEKHPEDIEKIFDHMKNREELIFFDNKEDLMEVQVPIQFGTTKTPWAVLIEIPQEKIFENANTMMFRMTLLLIALVIAGILTLWLISRSIARPLRKTSQVLRLISEEGDFSKRVDVELADETGQMAQAINNLMEALQKAFTDLNRVMSAVAEGNFMERVSSGLKGDMERLGSATNQSIDLLSETLQQVYATSNQVNSGANELSDSAQSLAGGTTEQAASLEEISSTMGEVSSLTRTNSDNAAQASQLSDSTMEIVENGNKQMKTMLQSMDEINTTSTDISKIIKTIDEIAFQTNLLALNAAVEAARAGKYGKGFAVVAEEVRNLAARSAEAAKNTTEMIESSVREVEKGVANAGKTADILTEINSSVSKVNDMVDEIFAGSKEQQSSIEEINKGLTQVNEVIQQNSSISEETASASEELSSQSEMLQQLVRKFKLNAGTVAEEPVVQPLVANNPIPEPTPPLVANNPIPEPTPPLVANNPIPEPTPPLVANNPIPEPTPSQITDETKPTSPRKVITLDDDDFGKY